MRETDPSILKQFTPEGKLAANFIRLAQRFVNELNKLIQGGDIKGARLLIESNSDQVFGESAPSRLSEIKAALLTYLEQHLTREITFQGRNYQIPAALLDNLTRGREKTRYSLHLEDLSAEPTT